MTVYVLFLHLIAVNLFIPLSGDGAAITTPFSTQDDCDAYKASYMATRHLTPEVAAETGMEYVCKPLVSALPQ